MFGRTKKHDRWLDWKIRHGLAKRGRCGGRMNPKGIVAGLLYKFKYSKLDVEPEPPSGAVFHQAVGGVVGASGETN